MQNRDERILLVMLPFNDPQIPPLGLANLKSYLKQHGYEVKTVDTNIEMEFRELFDRYFGIIDEFLPVNKKGNFYSMRLDISQYHSLAYLNYRKRLESYDYCQLSELGIENEVDYMGLIKMIIYKTFFIEVDAKLVRALDNVIGEFFERLEVYLLNLLQNEKPTVIGLSVCIAMLAASLFAFKLTKEKYPQIKTVMGGGIFADDLALSSPNFKYFVEKVPYIDKLIVGEGEILFLKYLKEELPVKQKVYTINDIDRQNIDLSTVNIPDFDDFQLDRYPYMPAYASVSCVYNCRFCTVPNQWGKYRKKSAAQVINELTRLYRKYGYQLFLMVDSLLNPMITDIAKEFLKSEIAIYWDGSLKVSKIVCNPENTLLWRRGGFYRAHLGIETGSQRMLDLMDKRITVEEIKSAITSLASAGIKTTTFWVVGYPGETDDDFRQSLHLAEELKDDIYETTIRPYLHYLTRQEETSEIEKKSGSKLLYPKNFKDKLIVQTWIKNCEPSRQETVNRLNRFNEHIQNLRIPNPYSWYDIYKADKRWKELHDNAVPSLSAFKDRTSYIDECKFVDGLYQPQNTLEDDGEFDF